MTHHASTRYANIHLLNTHAPKRVYVRAHVSVSIHLRATTLSRRLASFMSRTRRTRAAAASPARASTPPVDDDGDDAIRADWAARVEAVKRTTDNGMVSASLFAAIGKLREHLFVARDGELLLWQTLRAEHARATALAIAGANASAKKTNPWLVVTDAPGIFGQWIANHLLKDRNVDDEAPADRVAKFDALRKALRAALAKGAAKEAAAYNKWLAEQFDRRIKEAGGDAAAAAPALSPGSASSSSASSVVMVPASIATESEPEPESGSDSVSDSDEEKEADVRSIGGAPDGSSAPDADLVTELAQLRLALATSQQEVREHVSKLADATSINDKAAATILERGREARELKKAHTAAIQAAAAEKADLEAQINALTSETQITTREKTSLRGQLDALVQSTNKEKATLLAQLAALKDSKPGDDGALVQALNQQITELTAQQAADKALIQQLTHQFSNMQTDEQKRIRQLEDELDRLRSAPIVAIADPDASLPPTQSHSRVPSPVNVPKQQRLEPRALYVLLAGLVSA